jgi:hypothetical protein
MKVTIYNAEWLLILSIGSYPHASAFGRELTLLTEFGNILKWHETNLYARYEKYDDETKWNERWKSWKFNQATF